MLPWAGLEFLAELRFLALSGASYHPVLQDLWAIPCAITRILKEKSAAAQRRGHGNPAHESFPLAKPPKMSQSLALCGQNTKRLIHCSIFIVRKDFCIKAKRFIEIIPKSSSIYQLLGHIIVH